MHSGALLCGINISPMQEGNKYFDIYLMTYNCISHLGTLIEQSELSLEA